MIPITSPDDECLDDLCGTLRKWASRWASTSDWPQDALSLCGDAGVYRWFLPEEQGGFAWTATQKTQGYLKLAAADLTTTFIITQYMGSVRRIAGSENRIVAERWLSDLVSGAKMGTVGISHLTTSRRHLSKPVLQAEPCENGFRLNGFSPWVTGAPNADVFVVGATLDDGRELLAAVDAKSDGIRSGEGANLIALSASCTDRVDFRNVFVDESMLIAGPTNDVMNSGTGSTVGGLQTSTLAIGLATAAAAYLSTEAEKREDLRPAADELAKEIDQIQELLLRAVGGDESCSTADIRGQANRLVMRTTQAAMTAAKGAGFVDGHPVGRWCQQALFFLVWSCPQPIANAHLCELAGIS